MTKPSPPNDFLEVDDLDPATLAALLDRAEAWKRAPNRIPTLLAGRGVVMIFEKPSTRTRTEAPSFVEPAVRTRLPSPVSRSTHVARRTSSTTVREPYDLRRPRASRRCAVAGFSAATITSCPRASAWSSAVSPPQPRSRQ